MNKFATVILLISTLMLAACGSAEPTPEVAGPSTLAIMFANDDFHVGTPRVAVVMFDGADPAQGVTDVTATLFDLSSETPEARWNGPVTAYEDAPVPYFVVYPEIPAAGQWGLQISATTAAGAAETYNRTIEVTDAPRSPAIGSVPPASENRTSDTHDVGELTSGNEPNPDLYDQTVAEALDSGKPSLIIFATPAFCQTRVCGPAVDIVETAYAEIGDAANFIHLEIFKDFQEMTTADEVGEWGLTSEPWTFILDADGKVTARLGGPISKAEIMAELEPLLP